MSDYHLSLSIGKALWDDLVGAALPAQVAEGAFDLSRNIYQGVKQLGVKQKVSALLEDKGGAAPGLLSAKKKAGEIWARSRPQVYGAIQDMLRVEGDWRVMIDDRGTDFHYGDQRVGVDAHVKACITGRAYLLRQNIEFPFTIEKRLGASCHLGDIRFDGEKNAVVGSIQNPQIDLGENAILQVINQAASKLLAQQSDRFQDVPLIPRDQLDEMVMPAGGPLRLQMSIQDVNIEVDENDLKLNVRFGFAQRHLTDQSETL